MDGYDNIENVEYTIFLVLTWRKTFGCNSYQYGVTNVGGWVILLLALILSTA